MNMIKKISAKAMWPYTTRKMNYKILDNLRMSRRLWRNAGLMTKRRNIYSYSTIFWNITLFNLVLKICFQYCVESKAERDILKLIPAK